MKKIVSLLLVFIFVFSLTACGGTASGDDKSGFGQEDTREETDAAGETQEETDAAGESQDTGASGTVSADNILVAYFSWADNVSLDAGMEDDLDAVTSPSVVSPGNVQQLAGWVQERTGGRLFSIRVTDPYPADWDECLSRANQERGEDARPELVENVENLEDYDVVFLGYPNWWYGVPMALLSFLDNNNLSGKQVYLFCSHGTGGLAESVDIIEEALPDSEISDDVFDCYEEDAPDSQEEIESWLAGLGY